LFLHEAITNPVKQTHKKSCTDSFTTALKNETKDVCLLFRYDFFYEYFNLLGILFPTTLPSQDLFGCGVFIHF
jgi:hypothetical protein